MNKIVLLIDALNFKPQSLDFAAYIAKLGKSKIVGLFAEEQKFDTLPSIKSIGGQVFVEEIIQDTGEHKKQEESVRKNTELFMAWCQQKEIPAIVHHIKTDISDSVIAETRYADLLIADPSISFNGDNKVPSEFVMELLGKVECPTLISPEYFEQPEEVVFAFDGSKSSAFAIRQFYYQLPGLAEKQIIVLHINEDGADSEEDNPEDTKFKEWIEMHFSKISYVKLSGNAREALFGYFLQQRDPQNKLLVMGSFGRNMISSFFKPRTAELILKAVDVPMFIAHY